MPGCRLIAVCLLLLFWGCNSRQKEIAPADLPQIKAKGELTAVTLYSSTSYFQYKMESMGYEYDLIQNFATTHGLTLHIKVAENSGKLIEMLEAGEADIVAFPVAYKHERKQQVIYCGREELSSQVLVQRGGRQDKVLTNVTELIGKEVYVKSNTKFAERLHNLNVELGGGIHITEITNDSVSVEDLIEMVYRGEIPYTISDEKTARVNKTYFGQINTALEISFQQRASWVVRKESPLLAEAVNSWASDHAGNYTYKAATKRYFELSKQLLEEGAPTIRQGHLSPYDDLFKKHAHALDWDWQLVASISYQESHFKLNLVSWAGAVGLMGIMPKTARGLGVSPSDLTTPEISIHTGVEVLKRFKSGFSNIKDPTEKTKFTIASYNAGIGHIYDAQKLAQKYGKNPHIWDDNVAEYVRLKSSPEYYNDAVCKHGYLRGSETFVYVKDVLERYNHYKQQTTKKRPDLRNANR